VSTGTALKKEGRKIQLLPFLEETTDSEEFLSKNSWRNNTEMDAILILMDNTGADNMERVTTWMMDGTFKLFSIPFYQVTYKLCSA
jgi:hypothetical protein